MHLLLKHRMWQSLPKFIKHCVVEKLYEKHTGACIDYMMKNFWKIGADDLYRWEFNNTKIKLILVVRSRSHFESVRTSKTLNALNVFRSSLLKMVYVTATRRVSFHKLQYNVALTSCRTFMAVRAFCSMMNEFKIMVLENSYYWKQDLTIVSKHGVWYYSHLFSVISGFLLHFVGKLLVVVGYERVLLFIQSLRYRATIHPLAPHA